MGRWARRSIMGNGVKLGWRYMSASYIRVLLQKVYFSWESSCNLFIINKKNQTQAINRRFMGLVNLINHIQPKPLHYLASTFHVDNFAKTLVAVDFLYEFFSTSQAASASISTLLVSFESNCIDRPQVDDASLEIGTQSFRQVRAAMCVIPYVLCGCLYCLR